MQIVAPLEVSNTASRPSFNANATASPCSVMSAATARALPAHPKLGAAAFGAAAAAPTAAFGGGVRDGEATQPANTVPAPRATATPSDCFVKRNMGLLCTVMPSRPEKSFIERYVSPIVSAAAALFAFWQAEAAQGDLAEQSRIRELDWKPALNILSVRNSAESSAALGVFLQNVGKGPAKIRAVCQDRPFSELRPIDGLRMNASLLQPGDILKVDELIPLIEFRPISQEGWSEPQVNQVHMALRTLVEQGSSITICYESMYKGCFVTQRGPDTGKGWRQERFEDCNSRCCSGG